ncbi:exosome complex exonuclease rrp6-like [Folsomia candida]|uniref:exosome complex exonuclease rrp6-like n=1 Tax=Folsomia candida TaxID=158441 RepID=UPI0016051FD6|nr:exosome complex exonuclease rrp6-like [Folsomia candida]
MSREDLFALDGGNSFSSDIHGGSQFSTASLTKTQQRKIDYIKKLKMFKKPSIPQRCQEYINRRIMLNKLLFFDKIVHPYYERVMSFKLSPENLEIRKVDEGNVMLINDEKRFKFMCSHLSQQKEIAIDTEFGNMYFYRECIALIQISSYDYDFIVDPFLVYPFMKEFLEPIFLNESILKLVFSENDVPRFQRDFDMFFVGVIDLQSVYCTRLSINQKESLANVVKNLLGLELNKEYQGFYWITRPLPVRAIEYARKDSRMLLCCWNKFKEMYGTENVNLNESKLICSNVYKFPKCKKTPISDYTKLISNGKNIIVGNKFEIYEKIWKWCKEVAQIRDQNRDFITKNQTLRLLQLEKFNFEVVKKILDKIQDSDIKNLCSILNEKKQIDMEWIENERNFEVMEGNFNFEVPRGGSVEFVELEEPVDALGTPGRFNEISEDALGTPGVVKDAKDALGTLDMEIHQPIKDVSKYFKVLSVSTEPCVEELKRQRKIRNYQSRKNWKLKFKLENEERLRKGLSLLKKPYSKGKAWRERGALRKRLGLPIGPTTFTTRR